MQFRVIMVTDPPTHTHTHPQTGLITIHCAAASAQCVINTHKVNSSEVKQSRREQASVNMPIHDALNTL